MMIIIMKDRKICETSDLKFSLYRYINHDYVVVFYKLNLLKLMILIYLIIINFV